MKRPARLPSQLSSSFHKRLSAYTVAASAAGVGVLALTRAAEAKIVYTPSHQYIEPGATIPLNLTHGGLPNFLFRDFRVESSSSTGDVLSINSRYASQNRVVGVNSEASALSAGVEVGPKGPFSGRSNVMAEYGLGNGCGGQWCIPIGPRYLGLKFTINGSEIHYGWARLTVHHGIDHNYHKVWAILTGYAYETIPNKPIITGKTKGPDVVTVQPATLGRLAAGASAIPAWRRAGANK